MKPVQRLERVLIISGCMLVCLLLAARQSVALGNVSFSDIAKSIVLIDSGTNIGTGFFVQSNATRTLILTAQHVIVDKRSVRVYANAGYRGSFVATVIRVDRTRDLAILSVPTGPLPTLQIADSVSVGENVAAGGFDNLAYRYFQSSGDLQPDFHPGSVSSIRGEFVVDDVPTDPGNSGGPLFDAISGSVVGIVKGSFNENYYAAVGASSITRFLHEAGVDVGVRNDAASPAPEPAVTSANIATDGGGFVGIYFIDLTDAIRGKLGYTGTEGVGIYQVVGLSPADEAGLQAGDVITAVDNRPFKSGQALAEYFRSAIPGAELRVEFWSFADKTQKAVVLHSIERPANLSLTPPTPIPSAMTVAQIDAALDSLSLQVPITIPPRHCTSPCVVADATWRNVTSQITISGCAFSIASHWDWGANGGDHVDRLWTGYLNQIDPAGVETGSGLDSDGEVYWELKFTSKTGLSFNYQGYTFTNSQHEGFVELGSDPSVLIVPLRQLIQRCSSS